MAGEPRLAVIHGRRRLGKTELLRAWLRNAQGCYVQATEGTPALQRAALATDLEAVLPGFGEATYPTWRALLDALRRQWPSSSTVLALDEFPYLAQSSPELASLVQAMVDARDAVRVPLVLCGSSQRMMQGLVLNADAPLYGRAQCMLRVLPLPVGEIRSALGLSSATEAVEAYAAFGGVARYWNLVREGGYDSVDAAVDGLVFSSRGVLHDEATRVLRDEETAALERVACELIGSGVHRLSELAGRLGVKDTTLSKPLRHVVDLGLIEREAPYDFNHGRAASGGRRALYKPADPFLAMWHACVRPYLSGLNLAAAAARQHAREAWVHHVAAMWEALCRRCWHKLGFLQTEWEAAGRYWAGRNPDETGWDVVSVSADRQRVFLGECKWVRAPSRERIGALIRTVARRPVPVAVPDGMAVYRGLFLPECKDLPSELDGIRIWDAEAVIEAG